MANWVKERIALLQEAASHRKLLLTIGGLCSVVLGTADYLMALARSAFSSAPHTGGAGMTVFGAPSWLWGLALFFLFLFFWMFETALKLKRALTPVIALDFRPDAEGIVSTRTEIYGRVGQEIVKVRDDRAVYVRITLSCLSEKTVKGCAAFITKLEKGTVQGANFVNVSLNGSISLTPSPIDVHPRIQNLLDFVKAGEAENKLDGVTPWPFRLDGVLDDDATYRFTIEVIGDGIANSICVAIVWTKRWDAISAYKEY